MPDATLHDAVVALILDIKRKVNAMPTPTPAPAPTPTPTPRTVLGGVRPRTWIAASAVAGIALAVIGATFYAASWPKQPAVVADKGSAPATPVPSAAEKPVDLADRKLQERREALDANCLVKNHPATGRSSAEANDTISRWSQEDFQIYLNECKKLAGRNEEDARPANSGGDAQPRDTTSMPQRGAPLTKEQLDLLKRRALEMFPVDPPAVRQKAFVYDLRTAPDPRCRAEDVKDKETGYTYRRYRCPPRTIQRAGF